MGGKKLNDTRKQRFRSPQGPPDMADLHTHMIPGVDDGAPDLESALRALEKLWNDGVTAVAATPHLNASRPDGTRRSRAREAWPELAEAVAEGLPGLSLHRGFEILLDEVELNLEDEELRIGGTRFVLVEFHAFTIPQFSGEVLAQISDGGYVPILAHPERYWGYDRELSVVDEWRDAGALLQVNGGSILGESGETVRERAYQLLEGGWVDLIASDNHARPPRLLSLGTVWHHLTDHDLEEQARMLLAVNPHRILRDEMPFPVPPIEAKPGLLSRIARAFKGDRK